MKYPRWLPQSLTQWLLCACCAALLTFGATWAYLSIKYGPESVKAAKDALVHGDGLVGEARLAAKKSVTVSNDTDIAVKHLDGSLTKFDGLIGAGTGTLNAASGAVIKLGDVADSATTRINALATTQASADRAIASVETIPSHLNVALDNVGAGVTRLANFTGAAQTYLEGPLTFATNNAGELEDTSNTTLGHIDHKYFAPWDHKNPVGHYTNIGLGYVGLGATIVRDAK